MFMKFFSKRKSFSYDQIVNLKKNKLEIKFTEFSKVELQVVCIKI